MLLYLLTLMACWGDDPVAGRALGPGDDRPVWMFRENEGRWTRSDTPVAHSASSLGLGVDGDLLVLTMQCFWGDCGSESKRKSDGPPVHALTTRNLEDWKPAMWRPRDPEDRVPIDTEYRSSSGGAQVWFYGTHAGTPGDPADHRMPHTIMSASLVNGRLESPNVWIQGSGLADPAPLRVGKELWLFLTTKPGMAIGLAKGSPFQIEREWTGVSVPHAMVVGKDIWLWAQRVEQGRMVPVRSISHDLGQSWSGWTSPLPLDGMAGCGNPVGAVFKGQPVVFCVTEPVGGPGQ
jgi:hypothetical protein